MKLEKKCNRLAQQIYSSRKVYGSNKTLTFFLMLKMSTNGQKILIRENDRLRDSHKPSLEKTKKISAECSNCILTLIGPTEHAMSGKSDKKNNCARKMSEKKHVYIYIYISRESIAKLFVYMNRRNTR